MKLETGQTAPNFTVQDVLGRQIQLSQVKAKKIFLAFLRNTNCPLCSHHVLKISQKADFYKSQGLEIIVFYESHKNMFKNSPFFQETVFKDDKFSVVSDPQRTVYDLYKTEISPEKSTLEVLMQAGRILEVEAATKLGITGNGIEAGTHPDAIPADFIINENMIIEYAHYGRDSGDNISLDLIEMFLNTN